MDEITPRVKPGLGFTKSDCKESSKNWKLDLWICSNLKNSYLKQIQSVSVYHQNYSIRILCF